MQKKISYLYTLLIIDYLSIKFMMKKNIQIPIYLKEIIKANPKLKSGRKNYIEHEKRILDTLKLIKESSKRFKIKKF
jgi:hypothetical protein